MMDAPTSAPSHTWLGREFQRLEGMLRRQILQLRARHQLVESDRRGMFIPDSYADALLEQNGRSNGHTDMGAPDERIGNRDAFPPNPLVDLGTCFGLTPAELDILLIALAPALEPRFETLYAYVQNDVLKKRPSVDLALRLIFPEAQDRLQAMALLDPDAGLRRNRLLYLEESGRPLPARFLAVDDRIAAQLLGGRGLDERLRSFTRVQQDPSPLPSPEVHEPLVEELLAAADYLHLRPGLLVLHAPPGSGRKAVAGMICASLGRNLLAADLASADTASADDLVGLLLREAALQQAILYMALPPEPGEQAAWIRALPRLSAPVIIGLPQGDLDPWPEAPFIELRLPQPGFEARLQAWTDALSGYPMDDTVDLNEIAGRYELGPGRIREAAGYALTAAAAAERPLAGRDLAQAARLRSNRSLGGLAQQITPHYGWEDIVLPRRSRQMLREVYLSVRHRHQVYDGWGFRAKLALGKGVNALFFGPSGTGKTMAADILAAELGIDLYKIDLATVVSKYIGETEKNLARIFAAAEASNAILFFDEADALFGKRSEVKDARDRYANIEVAYLLQQMERYTGIAILATNLRGNMDDAFARRLHHVVEFPFPEEALRERIWRAIFPPELPLAEGIDYGFLAGQFELSGGNIRNIALSAAFFAAEAQRPVDMEMLVVGVARELVKMGKLPTRTAFQQYYPLVH